jgi:hypothetical protein
MQADALSYLIPGQSRSFAKTGTGWITAVRPSRRALQALLRMTFFLIAIIGLRHPEEARSAVSKDARAERQRHLSEREPQGQAPWSR